MLLDSTSQSLEVVLAGAVVTNQLPVSVEYVDMTSTATTGGTQLATTNSTTAVSALNTCTPKMRRCVLADGAHEGHSDALSARQDCSAQRLHVAVHGHGWMVGDQRSRIAANRRCRPDWPRRIEWIERCYWPNGADWPNWTNGASVLGSCHDAFNRQWLHHD